MFNIVICDDNAEFLESINKSLNRILMKEKYIELEYSIKTFSNTHQGLRYCFDNAVQLVFLDIDMPGLNGFDFADWMCRERLDTRIIFVSCHDSFVYSSLRFRPLRFLRKNCMDRELEEALDAAITEIMNENNYIEILSGNTKYTLFFSEILYFESKRNYVDAVFKNGNKATYRTTLKIIESNEMAKDYFARIHSGYLINVSKIKSMRFNEVIMENGDKLPIARGYAELKRKHLRFMRV